MYLNYQAEILAKDDFETFHQLFIIDEYFSIREQYKIYKIKW